MRTPLNCNWYSCRQEKRERAIAVVRADVSRAGQQPVAAGVAANGRVTATGREYQAGGYEELQPVGRQYEQSVAGQNRSRT